MAEVFVKTSLTGRKTQTLPQWQDLSCQNSSGCSTIVKLSAFKTMEEITHSLCLWEETVIAVDFGIKYDWTWDFLRRKNCFWVCVPHCTERMCIPLPICSFHPDCCFCWALYKPDRCGWSWIKYGCPIMCFLRRGQERASHISLRASESKQDQCELARSQNSKLSHTDFLLICWNFWFVCVTHLYFIFYVAVVTRRNHNVFITVHTHNRIRKHVRSDRCCGEDPLTSFWSFLKKWSSAHL